MQMALLFNESPVDKIDAYTWIVADIKRPCFGESVDEQLVEDGVVLGDSGLVEFEQTEVCVKRLATSEKADFIAKADALRSDARLNGD